jgi:HPt (histidine-containing phosphotransfer) domain-containing protein
VHNTVQRDKILVQDPKIRAMFYTELTKQHSEITEYIQNLNYSGLLKVIHIINGLAGNFDYDGLTHLAAESLRFLRNKQYQQAIQHCTSLNQKVSDVLNEYND